MNNTSLLSKLIKVACFLFGSLCLSFPVLGITAKNKTGKPIICVVKEEGEDKPELERVEPGEELDKDCDFKTSSICMAYCFYKGQINPLIITYSALLKTGKYTIEDEKGRPKLIKNVKR